MFFAGIAFGKTAGAALLRKMPLAGARRRKQKASNVLDIWEAGLAGIVIPQLRRKMRLLIDYEFSADWAAIAQSLRCAPKTVQWWADGTVVRKAGMVPARRFDDVVALFAAALGTQYTREEVAHLLYGEVDDLEAAFRSRAEVGWIKLVHEEAQTDTGTLYRVPAGSLSLVEVRATRSADAIKIGLGHWFRIEFATGLAGAYVLGLQRAQQNWGTIGATLERETIYLPARSPSGDPEVMRERISVGANSFMAVQVPAPFPADIRRAVENGITLDAGLLSRLAAFYVSQPRAARKIFAMDVLVEPA